MGLIIGERRIIHVHQILVTADTRVTDLKLTGFNRLRIALRHPEERLKRKRAFIKCILCQQYEIEVGKITVSGRLPIAKLVCFDEKGRLKYFLITENHVRL